MTRKKSETTRARNVGVKRSGAARPKSPKARKTAAGTLGRNSPRTAAKHRPARYVPPAHYAVPKSDGDSAVQQWIDLLPTWQAACMRRIDAIVVREIAGVHKAVRWHGVWYGVKGAGWILAAASLKAYLKLVFLDGASLTPIPPGALATKPQRALDVHECDALDEARFARWMRQARTLPGWGKA